MAKLSPRKIIKYKIIDKYENDLIPYEITLKEIETFKTRKIELELSYADVQRLYEKAGACSLTIENLLRNFIGDLIDGTYSNGSDATRCKIALRNVQCIVN